jgi:hypothetical protein
MTPDSKDGTAAMRKALVLAALLAAIPLLSGCLIASVAGAAVGVGGAVVGGAVDMVTTSPEEQQKKDNERLRRENEELRRQAAQNR